MKTLASALLLTLANLCCLPAQAAPQNYKLDTAHTQIGFAVERFGFNRVLGRFDHVEGELVHDTEQPERSSVTVRVRMNSLSSGDATRNEHLLGERWLKAQAFPQAEFRSAAVRALGDGRFAVEGQLSLMGVTQALTLEMRLNRLGPYPPQPRLQVLGASGSATLSRQQFGLRTAGNLIGDAVQLQLEVLALPVE